MSPSATKSTAPAKAAPAEAAESKPAEVTDPFANLTATESDVLFTTGGRPGKPVPESVRKLIVQSLNPGGEPKVLRLTLPSEAACKEFKGYLEKVSESHTRAGLDAPVTIRKTTEDDKVTVRFKVGPKQTRQTETPAAEGTATNAA